MSLKTSLRAPVRLASGAFILLCAALLATSCTNSLLDRSDVKRFVDDGSKSILSYNANGGSGVIPSAQYPVGASVALADVGVLKREGYFFDRWNTMSDGSGVSYAASSSITIPYDDLTLYAIWSLSPIVRTVTYNGNGAVGGTPPPPAGYLPGTTVTVAGNTGNLSTNTGYFLSGWNTRADGTGTSRSVGSMFTMEDADLTLYAVWKEIEGLLSPTWSAAGVATSTDRNGNPSASYYFFNGTPVTTSSYHFSSDQSFTVSVWFNTTFDPISPGDDTKYPKIFTQASAGFEYFMYLNKGHLGAWVWHSGYPSTDYHFVECDVSANTWYHAVMVYDGAGTKKLELYLDGVLQGTEVYDKDYAAAPTVDMQFGSYENWTYTGVIGDFRVYERALASAEVQALYYE